MKKMFRIWFAQILFLATVFLSGHPPWAQAAIFSHGIDFTGEANVSPPYTYVTIADNSNFIWTHDILGEIGGNELSEIDLVDAVLSLTYAKTDGKESWAVPGLGPLAATADPPKVTAFSLDSLRLDDLKADGLFSVSLTESSTGRDTLRLIDSTLSGHYELKSIPPPPVVNDPGSPSPPRHEAPEPAVLMLVASGLGMHFLRRTKK